MFQSLVEVINLKTLYNYKASQVEHWFELQR